MRISLKTRGGFDHIYIFFYTYGHFAIENKFQIQQKSSERLVLF